jgi:outer membrane protein OmpA-like peptidoglycan-associated protein
MQYAKSSAAVGAAMLVIFSTTGCATKKYVRQTVSPVENRVSGVEKTASSQAGQIGQLENGLSRTDERVTDVDRKAAAAGQEAAKANQAAQQAGQRADEATMMARNTANRLGEVVDNIDNYKMVTTESVLFPLNKSTLTQDAQAQLDQAVTQLGANKNFVLEVQGFTDATGSKNTNIALAQKRADEVVRYLTVNHNIPLRKIHVLGVGEENFVADNKTREGRKQNRRVEIKVFALDLGGTRAANDAASQATTPTTTPTSTQQQQR